MCGPCNVLWQNSPPILCIKPQIPSPFPSFISNMHNIHMKSLDCITYWRYGFKGFGINSHYFPLRQHPPIQFTDFYPLVSSRLSAWWFSQVACMCWCIETLEPKHWSPRCLPTERINAAVSLVICLNLISAFASALSLMSWIWSKLIFPIFHWTCCRILVTPTSNFSVHKNYQSPHFISNFF